MKVKTIWCHSWAKVEKSPYFELQQKQVKIDFRPFIHVEGVKEIRLQKIDPQ
jgi:uroporphyrinogen-III synthase